MDTCRNIIIIDALVCIGKYNNTYPIFFTFLQNKTHQFIETCTFVINLVWLNNVHVHTWCKKGVLNIANASNNIRQNNGGIHVHSVYN